MVSNRSCAYERILLQVKKSALSASGSGATKSPRFIYRRLAVGETLYSLAAFHCSRGEDETAAECMALLKAWSEGTAQGRARVEWLRKQGHVKHYPAEITGDRLNALCDGNGEDELDWAWWMIKSKADKETRTKQWGARHEEGKYWLDASCDFRDFFGRSARRESFADYYSKKGVELQPDQPMLLTH